MNMSFQKLLLLGAFLLLAATSLRGEEKKAKLTVNIVNTEENTGKLYVYLFDVADDYPMETEKARMTKVVRVKNNSGTAVFNGVEYGTYAIAVHHDINDNDKVDTNFLGIPNEDFGASNNAKGFMGPPSFEDASFSVNKKEMELQIDMD
jgi:uncharacterized protein (DUF2141 family)